MTNPNDNAFGFSADRLAGEYPGLTKREYFAAMAMQGLCAEDHSKECKTVALWSVGMADALIAELNKEVK